MFLTTGQRTHEVRIINGFSISLVENFFTAQCILRVDFLKNCSILNNYKHLADGKYPFNSFERNSHLLKDLYFFFINLFLILCYI